MSEKVGGENSLCAFPLHRQNNPILFKSIFRVAFVLLAGWSVLAPVQADRVSRAGDPLAVEAKKRNREIEQLRSGQIPSRLVEEWRLVEPGSKATQALNDYLLPIIHQVYGEKFDFEEQPIRLLLFDSGHINAFILRVAQPKIIALDKQVLTEFSSLDEVLALIGHELGHLYVENQLGPSPNSKQEELFADFWYIGLLEQNGYDSRQAERMIQRLEEQSRHFKGAGRTSRFEELLDVHGLGENRLKVVRHALALEDRNRGGLKNATTDLEASLVAAVREEEHHRFFDEFLAAEGFESSSDEKKILILRHYLKTVKPGYLARLNDLADFLLSLQFKADSEELRKQVELFANELLAFRQTGLSHHESEQNSNFSSTAYSRLRRVYGQLTGKANPRLGYHRRISAAIRRFIQSESIAEAKQNAFRFLELIEKSNIPISVLRRLDFPNFKIPTEAKIEKAVKSGDLLTVSWFNIKNFARLSRSEEIVRALWMLGIQDASSLGNMSIDFMDDILKGRIVQIARDIQAEDGINFHQLMLDSGGEILGVKEDLRMTSGEVSHEIKDGVRALLTARVNLLIDKLEQGDESAIDQLIDYVQRDLFSHEKLLAPSLAETDFARFWKLNERFLIQNDSTGNHRPFETQTALVSVLHDLAHSNHPKARESYRLFFLSDSENANAPNFRSYITSGSLRGVSVSDRFNYQSPLMRFLLKNPKGLLTQEEIIDLITFNSAFLSPKNEELENRRAASDDDEGLEIQAAIEQWADALGESMDDEQRVLSLYDLKNYKALESLRTLFDVDLPTTQTQLRRNFQEITKKVNSFSTTGDKRSTLQEFMLYELVAFALRNPKASIQLEDFLPFIMLIDHGFESETDIKEYFEHRFVKGREEWPQNLSPLSRAWVLHEKKGYFEKYPVLRDQLLKKVIEKISILDEPFEQVQSIEEIYLNVRILNPEHRLKLRKLYVEALTALWGEDDGSDAYFEKAKEKSEFIYSKLPHVEAEDLFSDLSNSITAQYRLTQMFRSTLNQLVSDRLFRSYDVGVLTESFMAAARRDPSIRKNLVLYLMAEEDDPEQEAVALDIASITEIFSRESDSDEGDGSPTDVSERSQMEVRYIHRNFWSAPLAARSLIMEDLIFPAGQNSDAEFRASMLFAMERLFPSAGSYAAEARSLLEDYVEVIPDYQRSLLISAMMVAAKKSEATQSMSVGQKLAMVLELMGPAEVKLGQAISSHPAVPEEIREGSRRLKQDADALKRWDLFKLFYDSVPEEKREGYRVLNILGSASYYVSFEVESPSGERMVFRVLRRNAMEKANNGFELLIKLAEKRGPSDPLYEVLIQLISQAKHMSAIETDSNVGKRQSEIASRLYDGRTVSVDEREFEFSVAEVLDAGKDFQLMKKALGDHFNDLPSKTQKQKKIKQSLAEAYVALELNIILQGMEFDHDRHGAQMRVNGNQITLFDHGAMALEPPTTEERQVMAKAIFDALVAQSQGGDLAASLFQSIKQIHEQTGEIPRYLLTVQKALLALGDFIQEIPEERLKSLVASAAQEGMHEDIQLTFLEQLLVNSDAVEAMMSSTSHDNCKEAIIKITRK